MIEEVVVEDGKYTFRYNTETAEFVCLRYGEPWRDFIGDKAVWALFAAMYDLKQTYDALALATGNSKPGRRKAPKC